MEAFFAKLPPTHVALEACGGSHHWARRLAAMGHTVQLIPPQYVKPFVRRGKNDRNDAEAISEAAARPEMPSVAVKSAEQQAEAIVLSARELLVWQRTHLVNAVRGHAAEFGVIAAKTISQLPGLLKAVGAAETVPATAKQMLAFLGAQVAQLDELAETRSVCGWDRRARTPDWEQHKADPVSQVLAEVPGIGPISALSLALTIDPGRFASGQHFVAWLGLVPKQHSTGGRQRLGGISRAGNERLRQMLVVGAMIVWAMMATGAAYRGSKTVAAPAAGAAVAA